MYIYIYIERERGGERVGSAVPAASPLFRTAARHTALDLHRRAGECGHTVHTRSTHGPHTHTHMDQGSV